MTKVNRYIFTIDRVAAVLFLWMFTKFFAEKRVLREKRN